LFDFAIGSLGTSLQWDLG